MSNDSPKNEVKAPADLSRSEMMTHAKQIAEKLSQNTAIMDSIRENPLATLRSEKVPDILIGLVMHNLELDPTRTDDNLSCSCTCDCGCNPSNDGASAGYAAGMTLHGWK